MPEVEVTLAVVAAVYSLILFDIEQLI